MSDAEMLENLGKLILALRTSRGLSQIDLALQTEIAVENLEMLESNGGWDIELMSLVKIATALGTTVGALTFKAEANLPV